MEMCATGVSWQLDMVLWDTKWQGSPLLGEQREEQGGGVGWWWWEEEES